MKHPPAVRDFPRMLHGGDYNPEQWIRTPEVWDEDFRLMKLAGVNSISLGIFSWAMLEPEEGRFTFDWMDEIFARCQRDGIRVILATPGGGRPAWMAAKYPEVLRVDAHGRRQLWGGRHNHCFTSPVFRDKCRIINTKLAERYGKHPMLALWHVNNEYNGECHCDLCKNAFRAFLKGRYDGDLDKLNHAWWATFWSHTITDWSQIDPPSPIGEQQVHGLALDWKRFITHQTIDCYRAEATPLREITPHVPVTTNLMTGGFTDVDYYDLARAGDVVSWDSYPLFHDRAAADDWASSLGPLWISFIHSQRRSMLQKPFLLMECSPGVQNYKPVNKLKRPGVHTVETLQAVAHGADSVCYFQWRKSRGSVEKFHGAVVDHYATDDNRTFQEVAEVGRILAKLSPVVGTSTRAEVAFIYDYENRWALNDAAGPRNDRKDKDYDAVVREHYRPFFSAGVDVDVLSSQDDFARYKLLVAPMLYMLKPGVAERIEQFVAAGGTFVTTFLSGVVDQSDLCFTTGFPGGPLRKVCGVRAEETDALYDDERVAVHATPAGALLNLTGQYHGGYLCDLLHAEGATVLATYASEFYAGRPAVTVNRHGQGRAFYVASRNETRFQSDLYNHLIDALEIPRALGTNLPDAVTAATRTDGQRNFTFLLSFRRDSCEIDLGTRKYTDVLTREPVAGRLSLPSYSVRILESTVTA